MTKKVLFHKVKFGPEETRSKHNNERATRTLDLDKEMNPSRFGRLASIDGRTERIWQRVTNRNALGYEVIDFGSMASKISSTEPGL